MELNLTQEICKVLDMRKGQNIAIVNIGHRTIIADQFIICSGRSTTQVKALANYVEDELAKLGVEPLRTEGKSEGRWAVIDYGDVIVHVFHEETRKLYTLEELWSDGTNVEYYNAD